LQTRSTQDGRQRKRKSRKAKPIRAAGGKKSMRITERGRGEGGRFGSHQVGF